ncbi:MAG TPA: hypothetical protein VJ689_05295 [Gaiellaceae bacterium]|nr:hypothetical protein [Gaiellaceae bacterium]
MALTSHIRSTRHLLAAIAVLLVAGLAAGTDTAAAKTVEVSLSTSTAADILDDILSKTEILLDNHGEKRTSGGEASWLEEDASYIRVSGLGERRFTIPEQRAKNLRLYKAYVAGMHATSISAYVSGSAIELAASFESGGLEMPVHCTRWALLKKYRWKAGCLIPLVGDGVQVDNARLTARLVPVLHGASVSYAPDPQVGFAADIRSGGLCGVFDGFCDWLTGYKKRLRDNAVAAAQKLLGDEKTRDFVAAGFRDELLRRGLVQPDWTITGFRSEGGGYVLTLVRPNLIDGASVSIGDFDAVTHSLTTTCPVNVGFRATIAATTPVSGTAWLEHDDHTTSAPLPWSAGAGSASSVVVRRFHGAAGHSYPLRYSRLVLTWKDEDGAQYHATSKWSFFTVNCLESTGTIVAP